MVRAFLNFSTWTSRGYAQMKRRPQHVIAVLIRRELASDSACRDSPAHRSGRVRGAAIDRHHGRNGMFENKLHAWARLQQNCKLVKAGQLTTQSDAVHEEHVYGGLVLYERLQKIVLYA